MNIVDRSFAQLAREILSLSDKEMYHRMRKSFDRVPQVTQRNCMRYFNQYNYWGRLDIDQGVYEEIELKQKTLQQHMDDFVWLYGRLGDYRSKKTLYAILNNWYAYDFASTTQTKEYLFDSYFDLDLLQCSEQEVFVDLGAYTGDTVLSYLRNYGEDCYRRIYCYEITPQNFGYLKMNLEKYPNIDCRLKGVSDAPGRLFVQDNAASSSANTLGETGGEAVDVVTLDDDIEQAVTLIKADIEGYEQKALRGAARHIANDHPRLLLSVYHSNDDLWQIPRMVDEYSGDYRFYLRYKSSPIYPTEIILFAL